MIKKAAVLLVSLVLAGGVLVGTASASSASQAKPVSVTQLQERPHQCKWIYRNHHRKRWCSPKQRHKVCRWVRQHRHHHWVRVRVCRWTWH